VFQKKKKKKKWLFQGGAGCFRAHAVTAILTAALCGGNGAHEFLGGILGLI
jgi:hypothetical protein